MIRYRIGQRRWTIAVDAADFLWRQFLKTKRITGTISHCRRNQQRFPVVFVSPCMREAIFTVFPMAVNSSL